MVPKIMAACCIALSGVMTAGVHAEEYPTRPVSVIVPFPAGGTPDAFARIIAERIGRNWGNPMVVEVKPGAGGSLGATLVANSAPDGYTALLATLSHVTNPSLSSAANYDPVGDFKGVAILATAPVVALVPAAMPVNTLKEFVEHVRQRPGEVNYLMPGIGTSMHLNTEMLKKTAGIDLVPIPYKGIPLGIPDLISGRLSFTMSPLSIANPLISKGLLRPLAVAAPKRVVELPDTPTFAEAGFPDAQVVSWYAIVVPAKTPRPVVERLNQEFNKAIRDPEVRNRLEAVGAIVSEPTSPENTDSLLKAEAMRWSQFFREANISRQ